MATTERHGGGALPDHGAELERGVTLPVRVLGDVHHYFGRVHTDAVQPSKYAGAPDDLGDERVYLVEVHRLEREDGDAEWILVYADEDGRPYFCRPWDDAAWGDVGIRHQTAVDHWVLEVGAEYVDAEDRERLAGLVDEHHWTSQGVGER